MKILFINLTNLILAQNQITAKMKVIIFIAQKVCLRAIKVHNIKKIHHTLMK